MCVCVGGGGGGGGRQQLMTAKRASFFLFSFFNRRLKSSMLSTLRMLSRRLSQSFGGAVFVMGLAPG